MDFLALRKEVMRRLEEDSDDPVIFSDIEVGEAINEGYEELSERTEWREASESLSISSQYTNLRTSLTLEPLSVSRVFNSATSRWLVWTNLSKLDARDRRWQSTTGSPEWVFVRGMDTLGLYPKPGTATSCKVWHTAIPTRMVADTDTPGFPQEFHPALVDYGLYDLFSQWREFKKSLEFYAKFLGWERRLNRWVRHRMRLDREAIHGYNPVRAAN